MKGSIELRPKPRQEVTVVCSKVVATSIAPPSPLTPVNQTFPEELGSKEKCRKSKQLTNENNIRL